MCDKKSVRLENIKQIRALNDPYRQEILSRIRLLGKPSTAKEIAVSMNEAPSKVNYHLKVLEKYNFVEIDHTDNINGIIAKYYKLTVHQYKFHGKGEHRTKEKDAEFISMVENMYDNAKINYINSIMQSLDKDDEESDSAGQLSTGKFYFNNEDIEEINAAFKRLSKNKKEGREVYSVFCSFIRED